MPINPIEENMTRQSESMKRTASARKSGTGIKALIMAASLAATLGGWGILAAGQVAAATAMQPSPLIAQSGSTTIQNNSPVTNQPTLRQSTLPTSPQRSFARTRSSR
jgi:hypothetical protein